VKSISSLTSKEADNFVWDIARLLNRVENEGMWTRELTSQLTIFAYEKRRAISWMELN
jgi:hypothetical protein